METICTKQEKLGNKINLKKEKCSGSRKKNCYYKYNLYSKKCSYYSNQCNIKAKLWESLQEYWEASFENGFLQNDLEKQFWK